MIKKNRGFRIFGTVIDKNSSEGIPHVTVKAIDKDLFFDDLLGTAVTDENGYFEISYDGEDFKELFFDNKPDIYLKIKNREGKVIYTTKNKVRYGADKTEEFIVKISKDLLGGEVKMKWDIKKSDELKTKIAQNEKLMRQLSEKVDSIFKEHGLVFQGMSYVFEPRMFTMDPGEAPEIMKKSREAMALAIIEDVYKKESIGKAYITDKYLEFSKCLPECGITDPLTLKIIEKFRVFGYAADDPVPIVNSSQLIKKIILNKELLSQCSEAIFGILETNGITFKENEGCVFTPLVFETPVYAQKVGIAEKPEQIRGFGPQVYADPTPEPAYRMLRPFPGIIDPPWGGPTPGVIIFKWWWIGIPNPVMLRALDIMREYGY